MSDTMFVFIILPGMLLAFGAAIYAGWYEARGARRDVEKLDRITRLAVDRATAQIDLLRRENEELKARLRGEPYR